MRQSAGFTDCFLTIVTRRLWNALAMMHVSRYRYDSVHEAFLSLAYTNLIHLERSALGLFARLQRPVGVNHGTLVQAGHTPQRSPRRGAPSTRTSSPSHSNRLSLAARRTTTRSPSRSSPVPASPGRYGITRASFFVALRARPRTPHRCKPWSRRWAAARRTC